MSKSSSNKKTSLEKKLLTEEKVFTILSPEVKLVSFISTHIDHNSFIEYINDIDVRKLMQLTIISKEGENIKIEQEESIFYVFILALLHNNKKIGDFIYDVLEGIGNKITRKEFDKMIKTVNRFINNKEQHMKGGTLLKQILYEIGIIGIFIYIAYYDYYIISSGVWRKFYNTAQELTDIGQKIRSGCGRYVPSKHVKFLAKYGFGYYGVGDSTMVLKIDSVIQCLLTPTYLSQNLQEIYLPPKKKNEILTELFEGLSTDYSETFPTVDTTETNKPSENMGQELVVRSPSFESHGLVVKDVKTNQIDLSQTIQQLEKLGKMNKDEFEKYFSMRMKPLPTQPVEPITDTSVSGYFSAVTTFMSDLYDVAKALNMQEVATVSSLSAQNAIIYSIQDTIKNHMRKLEDMQISLKREIEDITTNGTRLVEELSSLPDTVLRLFSLNTTAFFIFLYFTNKIKKNVNTYTRRRTTGD